MPADTDGGTGALPAHAEGGISAWPVRAQAEQSKAVVRVGLMLPTFTGSGKAPVEAARAAEEAGLDGVFVFDHLWPLGAAGRPSLSWVAVLGAVAAVTRRVHLGPLVARVGLLDDAHLLHALSTLAYAAGTDRVVAGLGAGDGMSAPENLAYGIGYASAAERLAALAAIADRLGSQGILTWVAGRSSNIREVAALHADALNVWGASPAELAREGADLRDRATHAGSPGRTATGLPVMTWGGQVLVGADEGEAARLLAVHGHRDGLVHGSVEAVAARLRELALAGATWAVCAPLNINTDAEGAIHNLARVRDRLRLP